MLRRDETFAVNFEKMVGRINHSQAGALGPCRKLEGLAVGYVMAVVGVAAVAAILIVAVLMAGIVMMVLHRTGCGHSPTRFFRRMTAEQQGVGRKNEDQQDDDPQQGLMSGDPRQYQLHRRVAARL